MHSVMPILLIMLYISLQETITRLFQSGPDDQKPMFVDSKNFLLLIRVSRRSMFVLRVLEIIIALNVHTVFYLYFHIVTNLIVLIS